MTEPEVWAELAQAEAVHLAAVDAQGRPMLRTLHGVVVDDAVCFHGGDHGDKLAAVGQPVVLQWERIVARIPSYFIDPERACPATTYFISGQAEGRLKRVTATAEKARIVAALMHRFQVEGGHAAIDPEDARYRKPLASLLVLRVRPERLSGKRKLGQNRPAQQIERVLEGLWQRGAPGDLHALELVRRHHPGRLSPAFLRGPAGTQLCVQPGPEDLAAAQALVADAYWNTETSPETIRGAHLGSPAWVGARDASGALVATARANSDGHKHATVYDVAVRPDLRGQGVGRALMGLLLDHPAVRQCDHVSLVTRDAQAFYAPFGFSALTPRYTPMRRSRPAPER